MEDGAKSEAFTPKHFGAENILVAVDSSCSRKFASIRGPFSRLFLSPPHPRKSAFICGLSRRRLGGGGFDCLLRVHPRLSRHSEAEADAFAVTFA
jgi:hypothetical protein